MMNPRRLECDDPLYLTKMFNTALKFCKLNDHIASGWPGSAGAQEVSVSWDPLLMSGGASFPFAPLADMVTWNSSWEAVRWRRGGHGALRPENLFLALGVLTLQKLL